MGIDIREIRKELENLAEPKYQKFSSALIPGVDNLIGVRIPMLRRIAKRIAKDGAYEYLDKAEDIYFEETMLQGLVICELRDDIDNVLKRVKDFVPKINNWSVCDSFCTHLKIVRENREQVWQFLDKYINSQNAYDIRFAVVIMIFYYIDEEYLPSLFKVFVGISHRDYYVKMAVAWAISICFIKYPEETMEYLKHNELDDETYNKSLQKIRESLKIDKETKAIIKGMKR